MLHLRRAHDHSLSVVLNNDGNLDRPVDGTRWRVPRVMELREDRIYYDIFPGKEIGPSAGMLEAFSKLGDLPPRSVFGFARKYGPLRICEHDLPCTHNTSPWPNICRPLGWDKNNCWEPLATWRSFARQAFAMLKVA